MSWDETISKLSGSVRMHAGKRMAVKDPLGGPHDFIEEVSYLSYEISCCMIGHPYVVEYVGGVQLGMGVPQNPG